MVGPEAGLRARRTLQLGGLLYGLALVALALGRDLPVLDLLVLPALLLLLPALAVAQLPLIEGHEVERIPAYVGSAAGIVVLGAVSLALGLRMAGAEGLGLALPPLPVLIGGSLLLALAGLALMELFYRYERGGGSDESGILRELLPRTGPERRVFVGLSFAAGTGEEVAYRGYAMVALVSVGASAWAAAVISSVSFAFLHAYQGRLGIVRTGLLGFVFALSVLATRSLWPAMIAHTAIDLAGGLWLGRRWVNGENREGAA